eukprot:gene6256-7791_t
MGFSGEEKQSLLKLKGVGNKIIERLIEMKLDSFEKIRKVDAQYILNRGAEITNSSCWKNSPQAKNAVNAIVNLVKQDIEVKDEKLNESEKKVSKKRQIKEEDLPIDVKEEENDETIGVKNKKQKIVLVKKKISSTTTKKKKVLVKPKKEKEEEEEEEDESN